MSRWRRKAQQAIDTPIEEITDGAPVVDGRAGQEEAWFSNHFHQAAGECLSFLTEAGVLLNNRKVCDIGCGDGLIDAGVLQLSQAQEFVGFDIAPGDEVVLRAALKQREIDTDFLSAFSMVRSEIARIPWGDDYFDVAVSWSAFEHVADPTALLREVHRILAPGGALFLQLWPFFWSQHGTHLWQWFPDGYANQVHSEEEIRRRIEEDEVTEAGWKQMMLGAYDTLNRFTVNDLEASLIDAGFEIKRFQLLTDTIQVPDGAEWRSAIDRSISGVKLVAVKRP